MDKKNIVVISGGNGSSIVLRALSSYTEQFNLIGVISMSDSGGSSGQLRRELGVLPPGDILRATIALSPYDEKTLWNVLYKNRPADVGVLSGHSVGNLFLSLATKHDGSFLHALSALHQAVEARGDVYPVTLDQSELSVELDNGEVVKGEHEIDRPADRTHRIKRAWLEPDVVLFDKAKTAIESADAVVFFLGSLYTSTAAALSVGGMAETLQQSHAKFVAVIGEAYEAQGEVGPTTVSEMINELEALLPRPLDHIVVGIADEGIVARGGYTEKQWNILSDDVENERVTHLAFRGADMDVNKPHLGKHLFDYISSL